MWNRNVRSSSVAPGSGGDGRGRDQGSKGSEELQRKWTDFEDSMKAMKDALLQENAEKSAKIRRLMEENILLEQTLMRVENAALQPGPIARPNQLVAFPAEVWELIIVNIDYSSDLEILCLAFPNLKPLVKRKKRTIFLFENVLPLVCKHLKLEDIVNCRLACEKWNQDVCALLANLNSPNLLSDSLSNDEDTSRTSIPDFKFNSQIKAAYRFDNDEKSKNFLNHMADHHGNPFVGRILSVLVESEIGFQSFWKSMLELVEKFGKHVWNFELRCPRGYYNQIACYKVLQEVLNYLPNLKYFAVACYFSSPGQSKSEMAREIGSSPLPPLPYLQSLKLGLDDETGMSTAFSPYFSSQIRRLVLLKDTLENVNLKDEWLRGLINLEHLEVQLKSTEGVYRLLKFPSQNLKKISLHSNHYPRPPISLTSEQVGSLIEIFSRLESLDLGFFQVAWASSVGSRMRFSRLKCLEISVDPHEDDLLHNLDFVLGLPSLKHLVIRRYPTAGTQRLQTNEMDKHSTLKIRKYLFIKQVLESNVWTLIPSLELLELKAYPRNEKYTRKMFENRVG